MRLKRIATKNKGSCTVIYAILSKNYTILRETSMKYPLNMFRRYLKINGNPTKRDPTTFVLLYVVPRPADNFEKAYVIAASKNPRECARRYTKAKAVHTYRLLSANVTTARFDAKIARFNCVRAVNLVPKVKSIADRLKNRNGAGRKALSKNASFMRRVKSLQKFARARRLALAKNYK